MIALFIGLIIWCIAQYKPNKPASTDNVLIEVPSNEENDYLETR